MVALVNDECVLTVADGDSGRVSLLSVTTWPDTEEIAAACGVPALTRIAPAVSVPAPSVIVHVVSGGDTSSLAGASWTPVGELASLGVPASIVGAIVGAMAAHDGSGPFPARRPEWFRLGWLAVVDCWIDEHLTDSGLQRSGPTEPGRLWSLSAVLRVPVAGPAGASAVWFKATCDWFRAEPAITQVVGSFAGGLVPSVIAADHTRAWMLMEPFPADGKPPEAGPLAAAALAAVQIRSLEHLPALRAAGCPDRSVQPTLDRFHHLIHGSIELPALTDEQRQTAIAMEPWIAEQVHELYGCGIPTALVHGDLHLGNVAWDGERALLFDWTDACVSHPFLDGPRIARSDEPETGDSIRDAYLAPWRVAFPEAEVDRAWELSVLGDAVFQAISYEAIYAAQEDASRWEMAGIVSGTLRRLGEQWLALRAN